MEQDQILEFVQRMAETEMTAEQEREFLTMLANTIKHHSISILNNNMTQMAATAKEAGYKIITGTGGEAPMKSLYINGQRVDL